MNTSVSPLPLPLWPMLGLSLALVCVTSAAVTISSQRAARTFRAQDAMSMETEAPELARQMMRSRGYKIPDASAPQAF